MHGRLLIIWTDLNLHEIIMTLQIMLDYTRSSA